MTVTRSVFKYQPVDVLGCVRLRTLVVVPNSYFPDIAQAGVCGNVKDVESVARESSSAVEVAVPTAALASVQTDPHMSRGASGDREVHLIDRFHVSDLYRDSPFDHDHLNL